MDDAPVSVIIVNWNHGRLLENCLDALLAQEYPCFDVMIVDNGSLDGSLDQIAHRFPSVQIQRFLENRGFSAAFDHGVRCTEGVFVLSLNPDVVLKPNFVAEMVCAASRDERIGMAAPKLLCANNPMHLDSTGLLIGRHRRPYDRGQGEPDRGQYDVGPYVFGACGAAALYRRAMLNDLAVDGEYFDGDFFAYCEDVDLAWRAQLRGWHCVYVPCATATHDRGWGDTLRKQGRVTKGSLGPRLALRNRYLMTIKNDALLHFLIDLPRILAMELPHLAYAALVRPKVLLGLLDLIRLWPSAARKRRWIRTRRVIDDAVVRRWFVAPEDMVAG